jgi:hypothetical protein
MKSLMIGILFILSFSLQAAGEPCISHGECQIDNELEQGQRCLIVITGLNSVGGITCSLRCYNVPLAYLCRKKKINGVRKFTGKCKIEKYRMPIYNPSNLDCSDAVDPSDIDF